MKKVAKNKSHQKTKKAEIEPVEDENLSSEEFETATDEIDDEPFPSEEETEQDETVEVPLKPETKPATETPELTNTQKIKALKKAIENKSSSLEREQTKCKDWLVQAKDRDDKATAEFNKRKTELESMIKKTEERYNKRIAKTKTWWWDYTENYTQTKVKKIEDDIALLNLELDKLEAKEPADA